MQGLPDGVFDLILTDPPYGITPAKWDTALDMKLYFSEFWRLLKPNGIAIVTADFKFANTCFNCAGKAFLEELIWHKTNPQSFLNASFRHLKSHEYVLIFGGTRKPTYNPQKKFKEGLKSKRLTIRTPKYESGGSTGTHKPFVGFSEGFAYPQSVITYSNQHGSLWGSKKAAVKHPTQKPIELWHYLVRTFSNEDDLVLDMFAGSGTTAAACIQLGRRYTLVERDDHYYSNILERIQETRYMPEYNTKQPKLF
jgi:DNA modification methylase